MRSGKSEIRVNELALVGANVGELKLKLIAKANVWRTNVKASTVNLC